MARKFSFDNAITKDIMAVASDSFADSIVMIDIGKIAPNSKNFYSVKDIDELADDIERQGLKHNLVVRESTDGYYIIKSGHRRFAAIKKLVDEGRRSSRTVPCIIDGEKSEAENIIDLIMLNATSRVITDSEMLQQYELLKKSFEELEAQGMKYPGRMRERIAETLKVSPAQVGKIENIKKNAAPEVFEAVKSGEMSISTANEIAKLDEVKQAEIISAKPAAEIKHKEVKELNSRTAAPPVPHKPEKENSVLYVAQDDEENSVLYVSQKNDEENNMVLHIAQDEEKENPVLYVAQDEKNMYHVELTQEEAELLSELLTQKLIFSDSNADTRYKPLNKVLDWLMETLNN